MLLDRPLPKRPVEVALLPAPARRARPHHCGLLHRPDGGEWSLMAAALSWMLRTGRTPR